MRAAPALATAALLALVPAAPAGAAFTAQQREQLAARAQAMMAAGSYPAH